MKKQTKTLRGGRKNKKIFCNILIFSVLIVETKLSISG